MTPRADFYRQSWSALPVREAGRDLAVLNYVLYALGFFTGITAVIAVVLAYGRRRAAAGVVRTHLDWQIRLFWHGVLLLVASAVLHAVVVGLGAITFGVGLVFLVVPWAIAAFWVLYTIWGIARGLHRLNRDLPIG